MIFLTDPFKLLEQLPEELRDQPLERLNGETPRQAAQHVADIGCYACRGALWDLVEENSVQH